MPFDPDAAHTLQKSWRRVTRSGNLNNKRAWEFHDFGDAEPYRAMVLCIPAVLRVILL